jgi:DDE superfamily endonuclease
MLVRTLWRTMHILLGGSHLLVPFKKDEINRNNPREREAKESYNFYLSQLRIRVEMAFGMLVNKWWIFKSPLMHNTTKASAIIQCAMRLHNLCISARLELSSTSDIDLAGDVTESPECPAFVPNSSYLDYLPSQTMLLPPVRGTTIYKNDNLLSLTTTGSVVGYSMTTTEMTQKKMKRMSNPINTSYIVTVLSFVAAQSSPNRR